MASTWLSQNQTVSVIFQDCLSFQVLNHSGKHYTFNIKDTLLPVDPVTGREQSTISYEYDFQIPENATLTKKNELFIPWESFNATYRGRPKEDAPKLNTTSIRQLSIMMRSFFGTQEGNFSLSIESISASKMKSKVAAVSSIEEKSKTQKRDSEMYTNRSPPHLNTTFLLCVGICVVGGVVYLSSKKEVNGFYTKLWKRM
jgi:hypothetical protein